MVELTINNIITINVKFAVPQFNLCFPNCEIACIKLGPEEVERVRYYIKKKQPCNLM